MSEFERDIQAHSGPSRTDLVVDQLLRLDAATVDLEVVRGVIAAQLGSRDMLPTARITHIVERLGDETLRHTVRDVLDEHLTNEQRVAEAVDATVAALIQLRPNMANPTVITQILNRLVFGRPFAMGDIRALQVDLRAGIPAERLVEKLFEHGPSIPSGLSVRKITDATVQAVNGAVAGTSGGKGKKKK